MLENIEKYKGKVFNCWFKGTGQDGTWYSFIHYVSDDTIPRVFASETIINDFRHVKYSKIEEIAVNFKKFEPINRYGLSVIISRVNIQDIDSSKIQEEKEITHPKIKLVNFRKF